MMHSKARETNCFPKFTFIILDNRKANSVNFNYDCHSLESSFVKQIFPALPARLRRPFSENAVLYLWVIK